MENLIQAGARRAGSAREAVENSEVLLTSLPASPDVEASYLEPGGLVERAKQGTILIDLSSVQPSTPRKIEPRARARGLQFLEAPVQRRRQRRPGRHPGHHGRWRSSRAGAGATGPAPHRAQHLSTSARCGAGNTVKAINNMMAYVNALAMMEGLALGVKAGLDPMTVYEVVKASSGGSKALERIPRSLLPRNFEPGFKVQLMNKDLETFTAIAKELHVPISFANVAQRYQQAALAAGLGEQDTSVVMTIIERLAAVQVSKG